MKTAVIYNSMTGHSKKIACAVAAALGTESVSIKDKPALSGIDLLFITGGIYGGASLPGTLSYIKTISCTNVKKVALITSSVSDEIGQDAVRKILESNGIEVLDEYRCSGSFLFIKLGHPNTEDLQGEARFAKKVKESI